jgi:branched-chain amino acid transport system permease protein
VAERLRSPRLWFAAAFLGLLAFLPLIAALAGQPYYLTVFSRIMVLGLAAVGLNLILGFGGLVSFGHALYVGLGAYSVGILSFHGVSSGVAHLGTALGAGTLAAVLVGLVCLRTSGMAFIMITLAFAQMFYFLAVSLRQYGGDDGMSIDSRSQFGPVTLEDATVLYYVIFGLLAAALYVFHRVVHSRFGMVLRGCRANERRMIALGFPTLRYKLAAYVVSALVCVLAGVLLANLTQYASPAYMQWIISGELIVMILFGGMSTLLGPVVGAAAIVLIEDVLTAFRPGLPWGIDAVVSAHWMAVLGALIIVVVLALKQGLYGWLATREAEDG